MSMCNKIVIVLESLLRIQILISWDFPERADFSQQLESLASNLMLT